MNVYTLGVNPVRVSVANILYMAALEDVGVASPLVISLRFEGGQLTRRCISHADHLAYWCQNYNQGLIRVRLEVMNWEHLLNQAPVGAPELGEVFSTRRLDEALASCRRATACTSGRILFIIDPTGGYR